MSSQLHDHRGRSYNTFALLWCEQCGKAERPPARPSMPDWVLDPYLECATCGEKLTLLCCAVTGSHYQKSLGNPHMTVATLGSLPDRWGRW